MQKRILERPRPIIIILFLCFFFFISISNLKGENIYRGDLWNLLNYFRINNVLNKYIQIKEEGDWPYLPVDIVLKKGDSSVDVFTLRKRLMITGDLTDNNQDDLYYFDDQLEEGVKRFQYRHGLIVDGIVGPKTITALNIPVTKRIEELRLNQSRIFNLFDDYIDRYILVNVPAYELKVIEDGREIIKMKAIVGKNHSRTPIFKDEMEYLVFNPTWRIPIRKTVREIIPIIKNDPTYLERKSIRVFDSWDENAEELIPEKVDWDKYNLNNFDLMLEQEPGPDNELGRIKFMFPNDYLVYIHDTPDKELFQYNTRTFSSGCIRIEKPFELALYCLKNHPEWDWNKIMSVIESGEPTEVYLQEAIPVVIVYWTAWVDETGIVHFREDIYSLNT